MKIKALKCKRCGSIIYSRSYCDCRWCKCNTYGVDGGYKNEMKIKIKGELTNDYEIIELNIKATEQDLYLDYMKSTNKFGVVYEK